MLKNLIKEYKPELLEDVAEVGRLADKYLSTKMDAKEEAIFYNKEAEKLLKNWGIEIRKAEYLLKTVR